MKKLTSLLGLLALPVALTAGTEYKAPVIKNPVCAVPFTGVVSVGYESSYIFRGLDLGGDAPWASIDTNWQLWDDLSLDLGAWYINPTDARDGVNGGLNNAVRDHSNDELDLYATFNFPLWVLNASLGVVHYYYPENTTRGADNNGFRAGTGNAASNFRNTEVNAGLGYSLPWFDIAWLTAYDFDLNNGDGSWYHELSGSRSWSLTDCLSLGLGAGIGFQDNYNMIDGGLGRDAFGVAGAGRGLHNGWSHAFVTLGLTWAMTETAAFDIYVGGNFPNDDVTTNGLAGRNTRGDQLHGGASVSVSF